MANKHFIISLDAGYNGFKTIVGEKTGEVTIQLMKFHDAANIEKCNMSRKITDLKEEDPLYVRATNPVTGERVYYVGGYPAKNRYDFTNEFKTDDEFYDAIDEKNEGGKYARFNTERFKMLVLASLFKAVNKLSGKSEELSKIMDNGNNFDLTIIVLVPHATLENDDIKNSIINCIRNKDFHKNYMFSIDGIKDEEMYELPEIIERAEILFESQTYASITCEVLNIIDEKLAGKKQVTDEDRNREFSSNLPAFAWDCGGKTIGIARVEEDATINSKSESNTDYAITNICMNTSNSIYKQYKYRIPQEKIEAYATEERIINDFNEEGEPVIIKIAPEYKKQIQATIKELFEYSMKEYKREMLTSNTFIVSGGAGELYADKLLKYVREAVAENFGEEVADKKNYCKAKGKYGDVENGSIYSIATGGLLLA